MRKVTCNLVVLAREFSKPAGRQSVNDDAFVLAAATDACSMVYLICLFMKMHLLALLQDNCLDLVRCALFCLHA